MCILIRVLLLLILNNLVVSQTDEEIIFTEARLSLQRTIQIIMLEGQVDNNCTLRNSIDKMEKRLANVNWEWTRNGTVLNKSDKFEINSNEFSSRLVKRAANFSDTGLYACIATYGQLKEKRIEFKLTVIDKLYALWIFLGSATFCLIICLCIIIYETLINRRKSPSRRRADESLVQN